MTEMTPAQIAAVRQAIIDQADAAHTAYPQYRGHWDGEEWELVSFTDDIETKMGQAFLAGDVTIAKWDGSSDGTWTAYSFRNHIDTSVYWMDVLPVEVVG